MHSPCSRLTPCFRNFSDSVENVSNFTFSKNNFLFSFILLVIDSKFGISPSIFAVSVHFLSHISEKLLFPPYFLKFSSDFVKITCVFFTYFTCFSFPSYFDHDAFMHHTMLVLDAPVYYPKLPIQRAAVVKYLTR